MSPLRRLFFLRKVDPLPLRGKAKPSQGDNSSFFKTGAWRVCPSRGPAGIYHDEVFHGLDAHKAAEILAVSENKRIDFWRRRLMFTRIRR